MRKTRWLTVAVILTMSLAARAAGLTELLVEADARMLSADECKQLAAAFNDPEQSENWIAVAKALDANWAHWKPRDIAEPLHRQWTDPPSRLKGLSFAQVKALWLALGALRRHDLGHHVAVDWTLASPQWKQLGLKQLSALVRRVRIRFSRESPRDNIAMKALVDLAWTAYLSRLTSLDGDEPLECLRLIVATGAHLSSRQQLRVFDDLTKLYGPTGEVFAGLSIEEINASARALSAIEQPNAAVKNQAAWHGRAARQGRVPAGMVPSAKWQPRRSSFCVPAGREEVPGYRLTQGGRTVAGMAERVVTHPSAGTPGAH